MSFPLGLQTALISAVTAAVVTLLVEYAAKPRLEARKDRIVNIARMRRALEVQLFLILNDPSFRLLETTDDPTGPSADLLKDRLRELSNELATAERFAEELYALGYRKSIGRVLNTSVAGAYYAIKQPVEDLEDEPQWSIIRKGLFEADTLVDISLRYCRPTWRIKYGHRHGRDEAFRDARIEEVSGKRREFLDQKFKEHCKRFDDELREFLGTD